MLGGPGCGKSSLLRTHLAALAEHRLAGGPGPVPVLVPAAALVEGPLPQALSRHATSELSAHGLLDELPPAFFAEEPRIGVPWTVLVDGVDEITDRAARRRVLRQLRAFAAEENRAPYRFVLASRPLPEDELALLGKQMAPYELQPFDVDDLGAFAQGWFTALGVPEPGALVESFRRALDRTDMWELARVPLMATMLCQLHAARAEQELPAGRGRLYHAFVALLHERLHAAGPTGIRSQTEAALERYGGSAVDRAQHMLDGWPELMARLAAARFADEEGRSMLDLLASLPATRPPAAVPAAGWREFLEAVLRRSGLLTLSGGDYDFLHQTLLEYLAARAVPAADVPGTAAGRLTETADDQLSYVGFLFDNGGPCPPGAVRMLEDLARRTGPRGARYVTGLASLGTLLPGSVRDLAARTLDGAARDPDEEAEERSQAVEALRELGRPFGSPLAPGLLDGLAGDSSVAARFRREAAHALSQEGDPRGAARLAALARDPSIDGAERVEAAESLSGTDDDLVTELLAELVLDSALDIHGKQSSAYELARRGDARGADVLGTFACDPAHDFDPRCKSASALTWLGDRRGPSLLASFARDPGLRHLDRVEAVDALARHGDAADAVDCLIALVRDTTLGTGSREQLVWMAAHVLKEVSGPVLEDAARGKFDGLAQDRDLDPHVRIQAAAVLAYAGDRRGPGHLAAFVRGAGLPGTARAHAACVLGSTDGPGADDALAAVAEDPGIGGILRVQAAGHLTDRRDPRGSGLLRALRDDRELGADARALAAEELGEEGPGEEEVPDS